LAKGRSTMEQEEIEMEQREKVLRAKLSKIFENFFKKVCPAITPSPPKAKISKRGHSFHKAQSSLCIHSCGLFTMQVEEISQARGHSLEFDIPFHDIGFDGG
jgi:hypothetical protein